MDTSRDLLGLDRFTQQSFHRGDIDARPETAGPRVSLTVLMARPLQQFEPLRIIGLMLHGLIFERPREHPQRLFIDVPFLLELQQDGLSVFGIPTASQSQPENLPQLDRVITTPQRSLCPHSIRNGEFNR